MIDPIDVLRDEREREISNFWKAPPVEDVGRVKIPDSKHETDLHKQVPSRSMRVRKPAHKQREREPQWSGRGPAKTDNRSWWVKR